MVKIVDCLQYRQLKFNYVILLLTNPNYLINDNEQLNKL